MLAINRINNISSASAAAAACTLAASCASWRATSSASAAATDGVATIRSQAGTALLSSCCQRRDELGNAQ